jgi:S-adenosylmethionine-dependent methyltransferase
VSTAAEQRPGTTGGAVHRVLDAEVARVRAARPGEPPRVVDVGGGSGSWAVPLAAAGCAVTVVDTSPNALAALERRARDAGVHPLVTPMQGDVDQLTDLVPPDADLVLGHGLLEVVDDPARAVASLIAVAAPGAAVSILAASRNSAVLGRVLLGRLAEARAVLTDPDGRFGPDDALRRRFDGPALRALLEATGELRVEILQGDDVLTGYLPGAVQDGGAATQRTVDELEDLASTVPALREVAARLHVLTRRAGG